MPTKKTTLEILLTSVLLLAAASPFSSAQSVDETQCQQCVTQATLMFANGDSVGAANLLRSFSSRCHHNMQLHLLLSTILSKQKTRIDEAEKEAEIATTIKPNSVPAHLQYAFTLRMNDKKEQAVSEFEQVVSLDPANYESWASLAVLYGELRNSARQKECEQRAASLSPAAWTARFQSVESIAKTGNIEALRSEIGKMFSDPNLPPPAQQELVNEALKLGAIKEANSGATKLVAQNPKSEAALKAKALCQLFLKDYGGCLTTAQALFDLDTASAEGQALKGLVLLEKGKLDQGARLIETAQKLKPKSAIVLMSWGRLEYARGNYQQSVQSLQNSLMVDARLSPVRLDLSRALFKSGLIDQALEEAQEALHQPDLANRASSLEARIKMSATNLPEDIAMGQELAQKSFRKSPNEPEAQLAMAEASLAGKNANISEAQQMANDVLSSNPASSDAYLVLGRVFLKQGNFNEEEKMLDKCIGLASGDADAWYLKSQNMRRDGHLDESIEVLRKLVASKEMAPQEAFALADALSEKGEKSEAGKFYKLSLRQGLLGSSAAKAREALRHTPSGQGTPEEEAGVKPQKPVNENLFVHDKGGNKAHH